MNKRRIGQTEQTVNPIGLGCMGFSHASGAPMDREQAIQTIRKAYALGYNFFDTAECYTGIHPDGTISWNEELVGEALKDVRDQVIIATKMGVQHNEDRTLALDSRPETIRKSLQESLKRLQTDYVDLYYQHRIDPNVEPETVAATMKELMEEGKIRAWGISEANEEYLRRAHAVCHVSAIQNRYSMMARWHENLFPVCEELGITFVAFSPMANGFLTGKYSPQTKFEGDQDYRKGMPQYTEEGYEKGRELLKYLEKLAEEKNVTSAQVSLAWILNKNPNIIPIPGSRKIERIAENLAAAEIELSEEEMQTIESLLDRTDFQVFGGHNG